MKDREPTDEEFYRKYEAYENETTDEFIRRFSTSEAELRDIIAYLIHHRELNRDMELEKLEAEADMLIEKLRDNQLARLMESIASFREILALHKKLIEENNKPGNENGEP